jgi:hypothetical protein
VVVETLPAAALVVSEPDFLLEVLIIAFDAPAAPVASRPV